jgi:hypothetical protein
VVLNIAIGLLTSCLSGGAVWLWQRGKHSREFRARSRFFGSKPGGTCLIVMNNKHGAPGSTHHSDVQALLEAAVLAHELGCDSAVRSSDEFRGSSTDAVEFCIGGPLGSNVRTAGHLAHSLPGVTVHPYEDEENRLTIDVGHRSFPWDKGTEEYVLIAKFLPPGARWPVVLICGQSAVTNHAGMYYLRRSYHEIADAVSSPSRFCVMVKVSSIPTYAHQGAALASDVTDLAFRD